MNILPKITRFRAYQLGEAGASYSYFDGYKFYLIEARVTKNSAESLIEEIKLCKKNKIDVLHITSWDDDHCYENELENILNNLKPDLIEYPGYSPSTENGISCLRIINSYQQNNSNSFSGVSKIKVSPEYINGLSNSIPFDYTRIFYNPKELYSKSNDNSLVIFFRTGSFTVLSLGDIESSGIADNLLSSNILKNEVDILILAHHGSAHSFCNQAKFLAAVKPRVAICCANYSSEYDHPDQDVRDILYENDINLYTTKTGDVIIESINDHNSEFRVTNYIKNSNQVSSYKTYQSKRYDKYESDNLKEMFNF